MASNLLYSKRLHALIKRARIVVEKQLDEATKNYGTSRTVESNGSQYSEMYGSVDFARDLESINKQLHTLENIQQIVEQEDI